MSQSKSYDLVVLGAGSGGVRAARIAASLGAKVALIEKRKIGGTCVNVGCVPKKLFSYAANLHFDLIRSAAWGYHIPQFNFDWNYWTNFVAKDINRLNGLYEATIKKSGADYFNGFGIVEDPHTISIQSSSHPAITLQADRLLLATGTRPNIVEVPGSEYWITSDEIFSLPELPKHLFIYGGGYIAVEIATIFAQWGTKVTLATRSTFLKDFDPDIVNRLYKEFDLLNIEYIVNDSVVRLEQKDNYISVHFKSGRSVVCNVSLCAAGRSIDLEDAGIKNLLLKKNTQGWLEVDSQFQTSISDVFAVGDITGYLPLTPVALRQGENVARHLFQKDFVLKPINYENIATAVFTSPPIATVGMTLEQAKKQGFTAHVFQADFLAMKYAPHREHAVKTLIKLIVCTESDRVLGFHMIGIDAPEIIQGMAVALQAGVTKAMLNETVGIHPTSAEEWVTLR
ncbi:MAG: FAD-dependent oxidoreductase [Pseudomonadota bacterium]